MKIKIKAKLYPSEDREKVTQAVKNIFPAVQLETLDDRIEGESSDPGSLENLKNKLGLQAIRDSARREIRKGKTESSIEFSLNKQAATVDKVSFSDGDTPLGSIKVTIETKRPDEIMNYLAPSQKEKS